MYGLAMAVVFIALDPAAGFAIQASPVIRVFSGVTEAGEATGQWLEIIHRRLPPEAYDSVAPVRKPINSSEQAWEDLIRSRVPEWTQEMAPLAELIQPIAPPVEVHIVMGNRGAADAFTHNPTTIGFDLAALQAGYGDAGLAENASRIDRFLRHEFVHLLQKAWLAEHPWTADSPMRGALMEIWAEGLGNYYSFSDRWMSQDGERSAAATRALAELEPRFVARLSALACASPEAAAPLTADLSWGRFDRKWGALSAALWLEADQRRSAAALRDFFVAGPGAVWDLADRHLLDALGAVLEEARAAESLCAVQSREGPA